MNIYVGNLPYDVSEQELQQAFEQYGKVDMVSIIKDKMSGRSKGFAFVEMSQQSDAMAAIDAMNGTEMNGRPLTVNEARPREDRPAGGGNRPGGNRGRGGYGGGNRDRDRDRGW